MIDEPVVVCAGILVSDLFVPPLADIPQPGQLIQIEPPLYQSGGCAANTAIDLAGLGARVRVCGRVGSDGLGTQVIEELQASGVEVSAITRSTTSATSQTVVLSVSGDDRRFLHAIGANAELTAADIEQGAQGADILVIGGYLVLPALDAQELLPVIDRARARGTIVLLDVVVPRGAVGVATLVRPLLDRVDAFLPNQDEAEAITGQADPVEQAQTLLAWGCPQVVITCGATGAVYADTDRILITDPLPIDYVDGSGSGDAFTAGFVLGRLRDWPMEDTLRYAAALGASVCRGLGCHSTLFTDDEARARMGEVGIHERTAR
ncbi:MAG: carbohydrate kinase family protein [Actinomycetales bacterium]